MISLATILHDPDSKLLPACYASLPKLHRLYDEICIMATDQTPYLGYLNDAIIQSKPANGIGEARRQCLRMATGDFIHYCDFDRILYWISKYPHELEQAIKTLQHYDFTIFERTHRAINSHPDFQRQTEIEANALASVRFGQVMDFLSGSRGISKQLKITLTDVSISKGAGIDIEWPLLAKAGKFTISSMLCEGLEYESDYFGTRRASRAEIITRIENLNEVLYIAT